MSSIAHCPRCDERVRIPQVDGPAEVRCPWCGAEFQLDEITRSLPPLLEVISVVEGHYQNFGVPGLESETEDEFQLASEDSFTVSTADPLSSAPDFSAGERMSPSVTSKPRARRRKESPFVSFLKMAGGGVAGIFIALLILQALGKVPDLGFWPFKGPNTKLFPTDLFSNQKTDDSNSLASNSDLDTQANQEDSSASNSQGIDLGVPDFAQMNEDSSSTNDTTESEPAGTVSISQLSESLNNYIRSNSLTPDETANKINELLVQLANDLSMNGENAITLSKRLDGFVDRLKYESKILKNMLEGSASRVGKFYSSDFNEETDVPVSLALVGQVKETDNGLALKTSAGDLLPMELEKQLDDIKKEAIVLIIGDVLEGGENLDINVLYAKSLRKE